MCQYERYAIKNRIAGFSLLELLISLSLGLLLIVVLGEIYLSNSRQYSVEQGLARIQENGRAAAQLLSRAVQSAGYLGCRSWQSNFPIEFRLADDLQQSVKQGPIAVYTANNNTWQPSLPDFLNTKVKAGTDVLLVNLAKHDAAILLGESTTNRLLSTAEPRFSVNDVVLVSDCEKASLLSISQQLLLNGDNQQLLTSQQSLAFRYDSNASIQGFLSLYFYVGATTRTNTSGEPVWALFVKNHYGDSLELIEGVEDMSIEYTTQNIDLLVDGFDIRSINIDLLLNSIEAVTAQSNNYSFQGQRFSSDDNLLRRQWHVYATVRARLYDEIA